MVKKEYLNLSFFISVVALDYQWQREKFWPQQK